MLAATLAAALTPSLAASLSATVSLAVSLPAPVSATTLARLPLAVELSQAAPLSGMESVRLLAHH